MIKLINFVGFRSRSKHKQGRLCPEAPHDRESTPGTSCTHSACRRRFSARVRGLSRSTVCDFQSSATVLHRGSLSPGSGTRPGTASEATSQAHPRVLSELRAWWRFANRLCKAYTNIPGVRHSRPTGVIAFSDTRCSWIARDSWHCLWQRNVTCTPAHFQSILPNLIPLIRLSQT